MSEQSSRLVRILSPPPATTSPLPVLLEKRKEDCLALLELLRKLAGFLLSGESGFLRFLQRLHEGSQIVYSGTDYA